MRTHPDRGPSIRRRFNGDGVHPLLPKGGKDNGVCAGNHQKHENGTNATGAILSDLNCREPMRTVGDGRATIANIYATGDNFEAVLAEGRSLGQFTTLKAARDAISEARKAVP